MIPDARFVGQTKSFWAHVRSISEQVGYTIRHQGTIKIPTLSEICAAMQSLELDIKHIITEPQTPSVFGALLISYFQHRADVLNQIVEPQLLDARKAEQLFENLCQKYRPNAEDIPWNKQKRGKEETGISNGDC